MRNLIPIISLLACASLASAAAQNAGRPAPAYEKIVQSLSYAVSNQPGVSSRQVFCGWHAAPQLFVTCRHNLEDGWQAGTELQLTDGGTARLRYVTTAHDGLAVFEVSPPVSVGRCLLVANREPTAGEVVTHIGMPYGGKVAYKRGRVTGPATVHGGGGGPAAAYLTDAVVVSGYSGGPVVDEAGYVVAISTAASPADGSSVIMPTAPLRAYLASYAANGPTDQPAAAEGVRPYVDVYVAKGFDCPPCKSWMSHAQKTRGTREFDFRVHEVSERQAAEHNIAVPYFVFSGRPMTGPVNSWADVDSWCRKMIASLKAPFRRSAKSTRLDSPPAETPTGDDVRALARSNVLLAQAIDPPPIPRQTIADKPEAEAEVDWTGVTIIVVASNEVPRAAALLEGVGKRTIDRLTGGKAQVLIVAERTSPTQFANVQSVAGVVGRLNLLVMVPRRDLPVVASAVVAAVEGRLLKAINERLPERIARAPVELITERLHPDVFDETLDAAATADAGRSQGTRGPLPNWELWTVLAAYVGRELAKVIQRRREAKHLSRLDQMTDKPKTRKKGGDLS